MRRQARKKAITKKLNKVTSDNLEKETEKLVKQANAMLDSLQRRYKKGTWASKKLLDRLSSKNLQVVTRKGKIKFPKSATRQQLLAINKAVTQFMESKTSTKKGIKSVRKQTIETLQGSLSRDDVELSYEDAEKLYELFGDTDFHSIAEKIGASALQAVIEDSIDEDDDSNTFLKRLEMYGGVEMGDLDLREKAISLHSKYVL